VRLARDKANALIAQGKTVKIILRRQEGLRPAAAQF